ncbi:S1 family peptidase [Herbaspirillum lusitanum]|uniref:S1 family peptidase n=1 Tax=Herbaspirillum lusitanum TaxID=213312 RepID=UPI0022374D9C|nr:serine protease [Herbaspirillum lusitanum]
MKNISGDSRRAARSTRFWYMLAAGCLLCLSCSAAPAESIEAQASGIFLNADGDVLTARHAVSGCRSLYVVKDGKVVMAILRAVSNEDDVAVLATALKPFLSAVFQRSALPPERSVAVFAEAYSRLLRLPDRARTLSNAITVPEEGGELQLLSGVKPGASGSAVLGAGGLVLGMVVERVAGALSGAGVAQAHVRNPAQTGAATLVKALPAAAIKHFLRAANVGFAESDTAQISAQQSPAARAFTLGAGVICG